MEEEWFHRNDWPSSHLTFHSFPLKSNFYPAASYVLGQALALVPQMMMDVLLFGTLVYWMVGFTATAGAFFLYLVLFLSFNFTMGQLL